MAWIAAGGQSDVGEFLALAKEVAEKVRKVSESESYYE
jgi:hypothetical protein